MAAHYRHCKVYTSASGPPTADNVVNLYGMEFPNGLSLEMCTFEEEKPRIPASVLILKKCVFENPAQLLNLLIHPGLIHLELNYVKLRAVIQKNSYKSFYDFFSEYDWNDENRNGHLLTATVEAIHIKEEFDTAKVIANVRLDSLKSVHFVDIMMASEIFKLFQPIRGKSHRLQRVVFARVYFQSEDLPARLLQPFTGLKVQLEHCKSEKRNVISSEAANAARVTVDRPPPSVVSPQKKNRYDDNVEEPGHSSIAATTAAVRSMHVTPFSVTKNGNTVTVTGANVFLEKPTVGPGMKTNVYVLKDNQETDNTNYIFEHCEFTGSFDEEDERLKLNQVIVRNCIISNVATFYDFCKKCKSLVLNRVMIKEYKEVIELMGRLGEISYENVDEDANIKTLTLDDVSWEIIHFGNALVHFTRIKTLEIKNIKPVIDKRILELILEPGLYRDLGRGRGKSTVWFKTDSPNVLGKIRFSNVRFASKKLMDVMKSQERTYHRVDFKQVSVYEIEYGSNVSYLVETDDTIHNEHWYLLTDKYYEDGRDVVT